QQAIKQIAELLGGWPVALRLAGHYLHSTGEPATDYLRWLQEELLLKKAQNGKNRAVSLDGIIQHSVNQLSKEARLALEITGVLAFAPFRERAKVALLKHFNHCMMWELCRLLISLLVHRQAWLLHSTERDLRFCRKVLNELVDMGLLERQGEGWQVSHSLIYAYVHKEMFLSDVTHKLLALYYRDFFERYSRAGSEGYALLDEERVHCLQVMKSCLNREQWKEVQDLARAMWEYLDQSERWPEQLAAQKMRLIAARRAGDLREQVLCYHTLGYECRKRGENEQAITYYTSALKRARKLNNNKEQILLLDSIAMIYQDLDKHEQALECYQQALSLCQKIGDQEKESDILNYIGQLFEEQDNYDQALHYYKQALALGQEGGNRYGEAEVLDDIGTIYQSQGQFAKAMECQEQALNIYYELGDQERQAGSLINIGFTLAALDQFARAEESMTLAVEMAETLELPELDEYRDALEQVRAERQGA
ncbi:MAG: tetratricopeptide repeat protein, partial [Candidatus Electrothrix sp. AW3_4]|nr:tetratricopeptide repeat protein [Candidatus Electrothrix gigas]